MNLSKPMNLSKLWKPAPKMLLTVAERHTCINVSDGLAQSQPNW